MKYRFMADHQHEHRVTAMCRVLKVSRSGYYGWKRRPASPRTVKNRQLLTRIEAIHTRSREAYGVIKTDRALREQGLSVGHNRIARLRQINGVNNSLSCPDSISLRCTVFVGHLIH